MTEMQIVGLGMATLDVLIRTRELPTWEHGARLSGLGFDGGGPVGTAMVAASRLGAKVGFVGTIGADESARIKRRSLEENGVDISRCVFHDAPEDQVVLVTVHADTGERVFSGFWHDMRQTLKPEDLDMDYITSADYLHVEGYHREAALYAAKAMKAAGKTVVMDGSQRSTPVPDETKELIEQIDVLICGSGFGPNLTGIHDDVWSCGKAALDMGPRIVVQTEGADGSYTVTKDEQFHVPAFDIDVIDTTGAGDVFHGAYIVGLLHGWSLRQTAQFATAVSALKCTKLGGRVGIPTFAATMAFLRERGIEISR